MGGFVGHVGIIGYMKLYLSSVGLPDPQAYAALFSSTSASIGLIANAWQVAPAAKAKPFIDTTKAALTTLGFTVEPIDLLDYTSKPDELKKHLQSLAGIWVTGGNTFYLNWAMRQAGFNTIIREVCEAGLVYAGESAGAVIAGPTLHGIEHLDNPAEAPELIWDGLGLIDYGIIPHWGEAKYADRLETARSAMAGKIATVKTLHNSEYVVVNE
jgi:dipeptidase E